MEPDQSEASVPITAYFGQPAFRYSNYDTPFWARGNRADGRWHVVGDGATQYFSLHPDGAWADLARREDLRTDEDLEFVRMKIWIATVSVGRIVDYRTFESAEQAGFSPDALIDDDQTRCQIEGKRLRDSGFDGVVAPSASLPGTLNLTIFGRRVLSTWGVETRLASTVPACVVAVGGPAHGLATRVRYVGDSHTGYEEYVERVAERSRERLLDESPRDDIDARVELRQPEDEDRGR